jgi:N-acetyl-alpha-D-glucosaminyl L-malate synthase BshA
VNVGIVCHPSYGGSGVVASELGLALAARGHRVHFFSHSLPFRVADGKPNVVFHEVEVTSYPLFKYPPYDQALATKLLAVHKSELLDIIHVHYAIPHAIAAYLCCRMIERGRRPRIITTLHGTDITLVGIDPSFFEITRFGIEQSDGVTAVSRYLAEETIQHFGPRREVRVIPNFIDAEVFTPSLRDETSRSAHVYPGEFLIGHLSNFRPVKRVKDVVRAFHRLQRHLPARLLMIGEGVELEPARHLAAELGIAERVTFAGALPRVERILAQLDLFLLPSEYESFGLAALEAMACGVPVVSSRAGGIPEVIEDGVSGILCEVGEPARVAEAALDLLRDPARRASVAAAARRRAVELFPQERIITRYEDYYREILEKPPEE